MEEKFTVEEFRNYILSQDSLGDVMYYLSVENIKKANNYGVEPCKEDCEHFDLAQGRNFCTCAESEFITCEGVCKCFVPKLL